MVLLLVGYELALNLIRGRQAAESTGSNVKIVEANLIELKCLAKSFLVI